MIGSPVAVFIELTHYCGCHGLHHSNRVPSVFGWQLMCQFLLSSRMQVAAKPLARTQKSLTREMQVLSTRLLQEETIRHFEVLSLDMANNCLNALYHMGGVSKEKRWVTLAKKNLVVVVDVILFCCWNSVHSCSSSCNA